MRYSSLALIKFAAVICTLFVGNVTNVAADTLSGKKAFECSALDGTWTSPNTCTLSGPVAGTIEIAYANIVLDCNGHELSSDNFADTIVLPPGSSRVTIKNCVIDASGGAGIYNSANGNHFINNVIYGGWAGIYLHFSFDTTVSGNEVSESSICVAAHSGANNKFNDNTFACNSGSLVFSEVNDTFERNTFSGLSGLGLRALCDSHQLLIFANSFVGTGISVGGGCNNPWSEDGARGPRNLLISNNDFHGSGASWAAVFFYSGLINPRVENNTIDNYETGIYFDVENKHIEITNNVIGNVRDGISNASGITHPGSDHLFAGNTIDNASRRAITVLGDSNVDIIDNFITNSGGVLIAKTHNTRFTDNTIRDGVTSSSTELATGDGCNYQMMIDVNADSGVTVVGATDTLIADNYIDTVTGDGVRVLPMKRSRINVPPEWMNATPPAPGTPRPLPPETAGCFWSPTPYQMPPYLDINDIQVLTSENVSIQRNTIISSGLDGISFRETNWGEISNNVVTDSLDDGVGLQDSSFNNVISNNFSGCGGGGIEESGTSTDNAIVGNIDNC